MNYHLNAFLSKGRIFFYVIITSILISQIGFARNYMTTSQQLKVQLQKNLIWALDHYHLAGISISYRIENSKIHSLNAGYADVKLKKPISKNTYFEIGSVTKAFLATLIMKEIIKGKITPDQTLDQINKNIGSTKNPLSILLKEHPYLGKITVRQYLTHTSGIPQSINSSAFIKIFNKNPMHIWPSKQLIDIAMSQTPYFKPGEKDCYGYTNTDYIILGKLLEALTGKSVEKNMNHLFTQVGLNKIYYMPEHPSLLPRKIKKDIANAYITPDSDSYKLNAFHTMPLVTFPNGTTAKDITPIAIHAASIGAPSGGIIAQSRTLVKWYWALFHGQVIPEKYFLKMLQGVPTANSNQKYAFAISITRTKKFGEIYSHDGDMYGYDANLLYIPRLNLVLSILINTSTRNLMHINSGIIGKLINTFFLIQPKK